MCSDGLDPSKQRSFGMRYSVAIGLLLTLAGCGGNVSNSPRQILQHPPKPCLLDRPRPQSQLPEIVPNPLWPQKRRKNLSSSHLLSTALSAPQRMPRVPVQNLTRKNRFRLSLPSYSRCRFCLGNGVARRGGNTRTSRPWTCMNGFGIFAPIPPNRL